LKTGHKRTRRVEIAADDEHHLQPNGQRLLLFARLLQGLGISQERLGIE